MADRRFLLAFSGALLAVSAATYVVHYWLFEDLHHILIFFVEDIAFIPIEVLLVTLVIHRLLESRAGAQRRDKLGMLIGAFFSTLGIDLLAALASADPSIDAVRARVREHGEWRPADLPELRRRLAGRAWHIDPAGADLGGIRGLLLGHEDFVLRLIENPALLEHESFSELLRSVFHAAEELGRREDLASLPAADRDHLATDLDRVYAPLATEWLDYIEYVGRHYPYLFSLAVRTSPFDPAASVVVEA
jgi:hypothetical protein